MVRLISTTLDLWPSEEQSCAWTPTSQAQPWRSLWCKGCTLHRGCPSCSGWCPSCSWWRSWWSWCRPGCGKGAQAGCYTGRRAHSNSGHVLLSWSHLDPAITILKGLLKRYNSQVFRSHKIQEFWSTRSFRELGIECVHQKYSSDMRWWLAYTYFLLCFLWLLPLLIFQPWIRGWNHPLHSGKLFCLLGTTHDCWPRLMLWNRLTLSNLSSAHKCFRNAR